MREWLSKAFANMVAPPGADRSFFYEAFVGTVIIGDKHVAEFRTKGYGQLTLRDTSDLDPIHRDLAFVEEQIRRVETGADPHPDPDSQAGKQYESYIQARQDLRSGTPVIVVSAPSVAPTP